MAEGFIRQRGNAWQVIVHAGRDPLTGKRRNLTGTARTKHEAQALRARLLTQVDEGQTAGHRRDPGPAARALAGMADLAWSTRVTYTDYIGRTILPTLGHLPLRRLDTATLDRFYSELCRRGGVGGRPMAPATVRQVHAILRRALDQAARWGWIPANPAVLASPPRLGSAEIRPSTPEEVSRLLETAYEADPDFAVLLWLAATTALGAGSCARCGGGVLTWGAAELLILRNLFHAAGRLVERDTKTHTARRLALSADSVALLDVHRRRCAEVLEKTLKRPRRSSSDS